MNFLSESFEIFAKRGEKFVIKSFTEKEFTQHLMYSLQTFDLQLK